MSATGRAYRHFQRIDYLADIVGADIAADVIKVRLEDEDIALRVTEDSPLDVSAAQVPVALEADDDAGNTAAVQAEELGTALGGTETALVTYLAQALASIGNDTLQVDQQGVVDVSSRDGRNLGDVDVTALPDHDEAFENQTSLASGGTVENALAAPGADTLEGRVVRGTTSYDVTIEWLDAPGGNVIFTTSVATGVAAGTETAISETAQSPYCNVIVADAGAGSGAVDAILNLT